MSINVETTYKTIIENNLFFFEIIEYMNININELPSINTIPKHIYEDKLNDFLSNNQRIPNIYLIETTLSISNLEEHNIFTSINKTNNIEYIMISEHIIDMFKNIFKKFNNALTNAEYIEYKLLIQEKRKYFKNSSLVKSKELLEEIEALKSFCDRVSNSLRSSISTLKWKKQNFSSLSDVSMDTTSKLKKLNQVKIIRDKYISPLYSFTSIKKSEFMLELNNIREFLHTNKKLYKLERTLDFYYKSYIILAKEAAEINKFFANYIKQSEDSLKISIGIEFLFNEIKTITDDLSDGRKTKFLIWNEPKKLRQINPFFINYKGTLKPTNIKNNLIEKETFELFNNYYLEEIKNKDIHRKIKTKALNEQYYEMKKEKAKEKERKENLLSMLIQLKTKIKTEDFKEKEITKYVIDFLNEGKYEWHLGHFQYLVKKIITNNEIILLGKKEIIKDGFKTNYYEIKIKD